MAAITAFVPIIVAIVENDFLVSNLGQEVVRMGIVKEVYRWVGIFSLFAFATNLLREIVKDMQDEKGDRELECRTMPIVIGQRWTKAIVVALAGTLIIAVIYVVNHFLQLPETVNIKYYLYYAIIAPLIFFAFMVIKANDEVDYRYSQYIMKGIMFLGLIFSSFYLQ